MLKKICHGFSYFILILVCLFIIFFSFIVFQIPIPFIKGTLLQKIGQEEPFLKNKISFSYVAIGWNYEISRPILAVKNLNYIDKDNNITINNFSIYRNPLQILKGDSSQKTIIFIDGINISLDIHTDKQKLENIYQKIMHIMHNNNVDNKNKSSYWLKDSNIDFDIYLERVALSLYKNQTQLTSINLNSGMITQHNSNFYGKVHANIQCYSKTCSSLTTEVNFNSLERTINGEILFHNVDEVRTVVSEVIPKLNLQALGLGKKSKANIVFASNLNSNNQISNLIAKIKLQNTKLKFLKKSINFDIANLETQIGYNKTSNVIKLNNFKIGFADNYVFREKIQEWKMPVKSLNTEINVNMSTGCVDIKNLNIHLKHNQYLQGSLFIDNIFSTKISYTVQASFINLTTKDLAQYWPKKILVNFYDWMMEHLLFENHIKYNVLELSFIQDMDATTFDLQEIKGKVHLDNAQLTYLPKSSLLYAKKVDVSYDSNTVDIRYKDLTIQNYDNVFSSSGLVSIYNQNYNAPDKPYQARLKLDLNIQSKITEVLQYLSSDPLNILDENTISPHWFDGSGEGKLLYDMSLDDNNIKLLKLDFKLKDVMYKKDLKSYPLKNGTLDLIVLNQELHTSGIAEFDGKPINVVVSINWQNAEKIISEYKIDLKQVKIDTIKQLDILPDLIWKYTDIDGETDISLDINMLGKDAHIQFMADMKDSAIAMKALNYDKPKSSRFFVSGEIFLHNLKTFLIKDINISSDKLNSNFNVNTENDAIKIAINKLRGSNLSLQGKINISNSDIDINLTGSKIDITNILKLIKEELKSDTVDNYNIEEIEFLSKDNVNSYNLKIDHSFLLETNTKRNVNVDCRFDFITANRKLARNVDLKLKIAGLEIEQIDMKAIFQKGLSSRTTYDKNTRLLEATIYNLGYALSFFDIYSGIKDGVLKGKINMFYKKDPKSNKTYLHTSGNIVVYDFIIGVQFASANINFVGENSFFVFQSIDLVGNFLAARYKGYLHSSYLNLNGTLLPAYTTNALIKNVPIVREILRGLFTQDIKNATGKEFFQINSNIVGYFGDLKYFFSRKDQNEIKSNKEKIDVIINQTNNDSMNETK